MNGSVSQPAPEEAPNDYTLTINIFQNVDYLFFHLELELFG